MHILNMKEISTNRYSSATERSYAVCRSSYRFRQWTSFHSDWKRNEKSSWIL